MDYVILISVFVLIFALLALYYINMQAPAPAPAPSPTPQWPAPAPQPQTSAPAPAPAPPSPVTVSVPEMVGCYLDKAERALPTQSSTFLTVDECAKVAAVAGSKYFGMQYPEGTSGGKAQCFYGNGVYDKYGTSTACKLKDGAGRNIGGWWANSVYKL